MPNRTCTMPDCLRKHWARGMCAAHYTAAWHQANSHELTCERCGGTFVGRASRASKYCSMRCAALAVSAAGVTAALTPEAIAKRKVNRDASFARKAEAKRQRLLPVLFDGVRMATPPSAPRRLKAGKPRLWVAGSCAWCSTPFVLVDQVQARYCSSRCMRNASTARQGRFAVRPEIRLAIYERDNWICQLCSDPVDKTLPTSDSWAATLDHIECQSWALIPDHSPANLRLAHRWCNSVRGDESYYTAEVLTA